MKKSPLLLFSEAIKVLREDAFLFELWAAAAWSPRKPLQSRRGPFHSHFMSCHFRSLARPLWAKSYA